MPQIEPLHVTFHHPTGMLTFDMCIVAVGEISCKSNCVTFHRPGGTLRAPLFGLQGGGVVVDSDAVANFVGCNIHDNIAVAVCLHL